MRHLNYGETIKSHHKVLLEIDGYKPKISTSIECAKGEAIISFEGMKMQIPDVFVRDMAYPDEHGMCIKVFEG